MDRAKNKGQYLINKLRNSTKKNAVKPRMNKKCMENLRINFTCNKMSNTRMNK